MKNILLTAAAFAALLAAETRATGVFYGLWWDGSLENFVTINPYTAEKTVLGNIPSVKYIAIGGSYAFDPDSSRYAFVGYDAGMNASYHILNAPTGQVIASYPKPDTIRSMVYNPGERKAYGLSWSDSATGPLDSLGHPTIPAGKEYFVSIDPATGARTNTYIPGVKFIRLNSHFLNPDSGRYVFAGQEDGGAMYYYVIDIHTGSLVSKLPHTMKIDNPVYNPTTGAVHGLWWSDSGKAVVDSGSGGLGGLLNPPGTEYFVTLAPDSTLTMTAIPGVKWITFNYTFDPDSQRYIFVGMGGSGPNRYYVVDAVTGALVSQTAVTEKIDNIAYARASSTIDSSFFPTRVRRAEAASRNARVQAFAGYLMLEASNTAGELSFSIRDVSGKTLLRRDGIREGRARVETRGLKAGIHLYQIRSGSAVLGQGKLLIR